MSRKLIQKISGIMVFMFVLSATLLGTDIPPAGASPYTDVNSHWAYNHILKMNLRGVVSGYQDGTFKPDNAVSQLEAVLMAVKNMEAATELSRIDTSRNLPFNVPDWAKQKAKRELLFAVDKGLIVPSENKFDASSLATREWMTQLMVRMIGKESEASSYAHQLSSFTDDASIASWSRGYVNAAVKYGIITGFADNSFKPKAIVTRAQSVVMLSQCEKYLDLDSIVQGKVLNISGSRLSISANGRVNTYELNSSTIIVDKDGNKCQLFDLQSNSTIYMIVQNEYAKYIAITEPGLAGNTVSGTVLKVIPENRLIVVEDENRTLYTKTVGSTVTCVNSSGNLCDFSQIQENSRVELSIDATGEVTSIIISTLGGNLSDTGIIVEIDTDKELLIIKNGSLYNSYQYSDLVEVEIDGMRFATVDDLQIGDEVKIKTENSLVTNIKLLKAKQELSFTGKVLVNSADKDLLVIEKEDGVIDSFSIAADVKINISGITSPLLSDILVDDNVKVVIEDGKITSITVTNRDVENIFSGTVVAVDISSKTLVLQNEDDELKTYEVNKLAEFKINGKDADLSDVLKDMKVEIELLGDKIIYLENRSSTEGIVVSVNEERNLISIKGKNGDTSTFKVSKNADIQIEHISRADLDDIKKNDYVELKVDSDDLVTDIIVEKTYIYEVTRVYSSYLKVIDEDNDSDYVYDDDKPEIIIPGISSPNIDDFKEGNTIKVTYRGFKVTKIELIAAVAGQITDIDTYDGTITIHTFDGKTVSVPFDRDDQIIDGDDTYYSLRSLNIGDRVKVKERVDGETGIYVMEKIRTRFADTEDNNTKLLVKRSSKYTYTRYNIASPCYVHKGSQTLTLRNLREDDWMDIYLLDDVVYEIDKVQ